MSKSLFLVDRSMSFDDCIELCNYHHHKDLEQSHGFLPSPIGGSTFTFSKTGKIFRSTLFLRKKIKLRSSG